MFFPNKKKIYSKKIIPKKIHPKKNHSKKIPQKTFSHAIRQSSPLHRCFRMPTPGQLGRPHRRHDERRPVLSAANVHSDHRIRPVRIGGDGHQFGRRNHHLHDGQRHRPKLFVLPAIGEHHHRSVRLGRYILSHAVVSMAGRQANADHHAARAHPEGLSPQRLRVR